MKEFTKVFELEMINSGYSVLLLPRPHQLRRPTRESILFQLREKIRVYKLGEKFRKGIEESRKVFKPEVYLLKLWSEADTYFRKFPRNLNIPAAK